MIRGESQYSVVLRPECRSIWYEVWYGERGTGEKAAVKLQWRRAGVRVVGWPGGGRRMRRGRRELPTR